MKLKIFYSLFLFIGILKCYAQKLDTDGLNNLDNIYLYSLKEYCNSQDSLKTKIIYVKREYFVGENWPTKIDNFEIKYLQNREYKNVIKQNGGSITLIGISPLEYRHDNFYVGIIPFSVTRKKKMTYLSNGGGLIVNFQFDAAKKCFTFKGKEWNWL
jgi:hypothetical protein